MKRTLIISLLFCCLSIPGISQNAESDSVNVIDENGKKQGYWIKYWDDEKQVMRYFGHFKDDIPVDTFFYYYPTGEFQSWIAYSDDGYGITRIYHPNRKIMARGRYYNQKKDSTWNYYNPKSQLISSENYIVGKKYGLWKVYFDDGQVAREQNWENDMKNGITREYFPDGTLKLEMNYEDDKAIGIGKFYHKNGELWMTGEYINDAKEGLWEVYDSTGTLTEEIKYHIGIQEGGTPWVELPDSSKYQRKDRLDEMDFYPEEEYPEVEDNSRKKGRKR